METGARAAYSVAWASNGIIGYASPGGRITAKRNALGNWRNAEERYETPSPCQTPTLCTIIGPRTYRKRCPETEGVGRRGRDDLGNGSNLKL